MGSSPTGTALQLHGRVEQPGVLASLSRRRSRVQIPSWSLSPPQCVPSWRRSVGSQEPDLPIGTRCGVGEFGVPAPTVRSGVTGTCRPHKPDALGSSPSSATIGYDVVCPRCCSVFASTVTQNLVVRATVPRIGLGSAIGLAVTGSLRLRAGRTRLAPSAVSLVSRAMSRSVRPAGQHNSIR